MKQTFKEFYTNPNLYCTPDHPVDYGFDTRGRIVMRTLSSHRPSMAEDSSQKFFEDCDFIALDRQDAENILDMLNEAITKLESGTRQDNDVEVFGKKAISYERLIDALNRTIWDTSKTGT